MTANISANCDPRLKELLFEHADRLGVTLSELVVQVLADHVGRPELGKIPRKSIGRPRKPLMA